VHHEELLNIHTYRASWVLPEDPDTIYVEYEFWRVLNEAQRETLLAQEIVRSETLRASPDDAKAAAAAAKAALALDPGKILQRTLEDILKDYRIYNGVDRIELFITHPHGDHSIYIAPFVRGKMQKNLVARPVPELTDELRIELGNRFTHEVTSYLLRPTKRVVTVIDMGGYKGDGPDPFIETVNPHYRIGKKKLMKPVTIYADRATARKLELEKKLKGWLREGLKVELKIFDHDRQTMKITDRDFNAFEVTAHHAFHLPKEVGSSIFTMKKLGRDGKFISSFALVSEIGDAFPYGTDEETIRDIAVSQSIAIDGTNFSSGRVSPTPVRHQDNKIHQYTARLNRSWAMLTHLNVTMVGTVSEALEASRTLDPDIPIIILAGKDGIEQLKDIYRETESGNPLLKQRGNLWFLDSDDVVKESRGAKIYFVSSVSQFYHAWREVMSKKIKIQEVLPARLRQLYAAGRTTAETGEYLEDWAKNPGLTADEFVWLLEELQKGEWDIFAAADVIDSMTNRIMQTVRDYFSGLTDARQQPTGNPTVEKWAMARLLQGLDAFIAERRPRWEKTAKKDIPALIRKDLGGYLDVAIPFTEQARERGWLLQIVQMLDSMERLDVVTEAKDRRQLFEESTAKLFDAISREAAARKMPDGFTKTLVDDLMQRLRQKQGEWAQFQSAHLPYLILDDTGRFVKRLAGDSGWSPADTKRLTEKVTTELNLYRQTATALPEYVLKKALFAMLEEGVLPAGEAERAKILLLLDKMDRTDPRVMTALVRLFGVKTPGLNKRVSRSLLADERGQLQRFEVRLENVYNAQRGALTRADAEDLLRAWSAHPWAKPEYEADWINVLLDRYVSAVTTNKKWLGLDGAELYRQLLYAVDQCDLKGWTPAQVQALFESLFDVKELPHKEWHDLVLKFVAGVPDNNTRMTLVSYLGPAEKRDLRKYEQRKGMRQREQEDIKAIEAMFWELARTGQGKAVIIASGHFGSMSQKGSQLLNQLFDKRYAEVLIEGRPRTEGRQGKISGQLISREQMALMGKYRPIRIRHEHQWMSGHITFEESTKLLELIYNARVKMGLVKAGGPRIPERGVERLTPDELRKFELMLMKVLFTTSSNMMTAGEDEDEVNISEEIGDEKRRIIEIFGELFGDLEVGAGRKSINIGKGDWKSKQYGRRIPRDNAYVRTLYDRAVKGEIDPDLSNLVSSKKPAEYADDLSRIAKKDADGAYERFRALEQYLESQVLRLGLRISLDYGSRRVIQEQEIGVVPRGEEAQRQFERLPAESKGLYFQFARALEDAARETLGGEFFELVKRGTDRYFDRPPEFFDQDGKITASLEMLVRRYSQPGFAKAAAWVDPLKLFAQKQKLDFRIEMPRTGYEWAKLYEFLRAASLGKFDQLSRKAADEAAKAVKQGDFSIGIDGGYTLERRGGTLTLLLTATPAAVMPVVEPREAAAVDDAA